MVNIATVLEAVSTLSSHHARRMCFTYARKTCSSSERTEATAAELAIDPAETTLSVSITDTVMMLRISGIVSVWEMEMILITWLLVQHNDKTVNLEIESASGRSAKHEMRREQHSRLSQRERGAVKIK